MTSVLDQAVSLAQMLLQHQGAITSEKIASVADELLCMPTFSSGLDRDQLISALEEKFTVWTDDARVLGEDDDHIAWLPGKRTEIDWAFWNRYHMLLQNRLPNSAIESIDKVTTEILARLEDPSRDGPWDRRGLVMGHVQSGKTANYTGLICKAADAGYKVIIVLAGMHNNLRSQTQIRLDEGFLGYQATTGTSAEGAFEKIGVGNLDPNPRADSVTNRHENGDFNAAAARQFAIHPGGKPLLFVVKKNVSILRRVLSWIRASANITDPDSGRKFHSDVPLLVIDDEADQASVDTRSPALDEQGNPDPDHDPTATNKLIRQLLYSFGKSAYVGFTATPFANIFIHERNRTDSEGEDLFPRSFIVNIPPPSNYIGAARVFGISEDPDRGIEEVEPLPITRTVDDYAVKRDELGEVSESGWIRPDETDGWMPPRLVDRTGHIPVWNGLRQVPPSMRRAVLAFILSTATRQIREGTESHNSMLIHVVRFKDVQARVTEQVEALLDEIRLRLQHGEGHRSPTLYEELESIWRSDYIPTSESGLFTRKLVGEDLFLPPWEKVKQQIWPAVSSIQVRTINGSAGDVLDYANHVTHGLNVIAIGGDKLSRGLTLEGLTVSYFLRASKMYDTLMQMGRWFGYKGKYVDVCRLFTTEELMEWFSHIATATEELRDEFDYMVNVGGTPKDYGLKVRAHPVLTVTSAAKMRSGEQMRLSYAGDISEVIIFDTSEAIVRRNLDATLNLLDQLGGSVSPPGLEKGTYWGGVPAEKILQFLSEYRVHDDAKRVNTSLLSRYIEKQNMRGELIDWGVLLASPSKGNAYPIDGIGNVGLVERAQFPENQNLERSKYTIRRLVNPTDEAADLKKGDAGDPWNTALEKTIDQWTESDTRNPDAKCPARPGGPQIRAERPPARGLLIIYLLDNNYEKAKLNTSLPIPGVALSFPASSTAEPITYTVNNVFSNAGDVADF